MPVCTYMVKVIANTIAAESFAVMSQKVLEMNTDIEALILNEMIDHRNGYDPITGERFTSFSPPYGSIYSRVSLVAPDGALVNCEILASGKQVDGAVLYVHGAAFMRRTNDLNLRTADRLCSMTGNLVCVPDYRIGADYTYDQMVMDVIVGFRYLTEKLGYSPSRVTMLADSSGCVTLLQTVREMGKQGMPVPGKIILWSPPVHERVDHDLVNQGKERDLAFSTNDLLFLSNNVYFAVMCADMSARDAYPIYGDFSCLKDSRVLIQAGSLEMLIDDAHQLHDLLSDICSCTLEVYEDMFHNFQAYYSYCEMSKVCWESVTNFITVAENKEVSNA